MVNRGTRSGNEILADAFERYRLGPVVGSHTVLDIGSGAGDVAMLAGRLVRPNGMVLGIKRSAESVALATQPVTAAANVAVRFEESDLNTYRPPAKYDALIGPFVLPYLADPAGVLRPRCWSTGVASCGNACGSGRDCAGELPAYHRRMLPGALA